jgi:uncharacterized membrane protein
MLVTDFLLWFFIYSFVGWAWETALFTVQERRFVNRGFLNGPFCPIYGCGGLLFLLLLAGRVHNVFAIFVLAVVLATALEYLTAVILENLFHAKWWDYSMFPLNYKGRISVISSAVFGIMSVLQLKFIHPFVKGMTDQLHPSFKTLLVLAILLYLFVDLSLTVRHVFILNGRLSEIQVALNGFIGKYARRAGEFKNSVLENFEDSEFYSDRIKTLFSLDRLQNTRLFRAFPKLRSFRYDGAMKKLRDKLTRKNKD